MTNDTLKTVQALVDALMKLRKAADARGYDLMDNSYPQKYWYALRDQADGALDAGRALIAQMQRDAVQPGWKLVPVEPTEEMLAAAIASWGAENPGSAAVYRAMLDAAPHPEAQALDSQLQQPDADSTRASGVCASTWQPIETAPKGRKVLAGYLNRAGKWRTIVACYYLPQTLELSDNYLGEDDDGFAPEGWYEECESSEVILPTDAPPTHWMPLPSAPTGADTARHGQHDHAGSHAPSAQSSKAALSDDEIVQLARRHTVLNGSHEFCNYIAFARAILARAGIGESRHE